MQNSRPVLLTAAASGAAATVAALFGADQFAAQAGLLTLGALGVLVAARHATARPVRWPLLAGITVLAVAVAIPDLLTPPATVPQALRPADGGTGSFVRDAVAAEWPTTLAVLLVCLASLRALTAGRTARPAPAHPVETGEQHLPAERRRRDPAVLAAAAGCLLIVVAVADLVLVAAAQKNGEATGVLAVVALPLLVALLAIGSAVFGAYRMTVDADAAASTADPGEADPDAAEPGVPDPGAVDTGGIVAAAAVAVGGLSLGVAALSVVYLGVLSAPLPYGHTGNLVLGTAVISTGWGDLDLLAALRLAGMLAGAGGIVYGTARAHGGVQTSGTVSPDGPPA